MTDIDTAQLRALAEAAKARHRHDLATRGAYDGDDEWYLTYEDGELVRALVNDPDRIIALLDELDVANARIAELEHGRRDSDNWATQFRDERDKAESVAADYREVLERVEPLVHHWYNADLTHATDQCPACLIGTTLAKHEKGDGK